MKILLGSSLYPPNAIGGAERVAHALSNDLVNEGHSVSVITTQPEGDAHHAIVTGVSVHYLVVKNLYRPFGHFEPGPIRKSLWRLFDTYNVLMTRQMMQIIEREKPDVLNTHNITGLSIAIWTAAKRLGIPIVHTMHDQYLLCHRSTMFKVGRNCAKQCVDCLILTTPRKLLSGSVSCAIGVSEFILDRHNKLGYFKNADSLVIYNKPQRPKLSQSKINSVSRPLRFGFLGQLIPTKGLDALISAYIDAGLEDAELWIAGNGDSPYALRLRQSTKNDHNIRWLGFVQPEDFFSKVDVLVVPSLWNDTAPLVISEAMCCGVPVLAARRGGIPELVKPGTGWLYDPNVPYALRIALQACSESREQLSTMKDVCLMNAKKFDSYDWTAEYVLAYESAINRHHAEHRK